MRIGRSMVALGALLTGLLGLFGFVISIQSQGGTLLIESSVDDVNVRVSQGETVVRKLTVTKAGTKIDVAAGSYTVTIEGNVDGIAIENDKVNLRRGDTEIVKLTYQPPSEPTPAANLDAHKSPQDVQQIIERTNLYVTDVRVAGQVLYFKLHRRGDEPPVNARLKIQSHYQKPVPFAWSGFAADIGVMPEGVAEISLPLIPAQGTEVALLFPDNETALAAAEQLSSIGGRSLLLEQQQANLGTGEQKRDGIIHGVHPTGGRYSIEFSMVFDSTTASSLNISNIQRPQFTGVHWRPMYLAIATHHHTAKRHSLSESQEQEIRTLFDEFVRIATVETHDEILKLTQAKIEALLTREQDEAVRREIWLGWNVTKFRDPKRLAQLQISDKQQQQIDAIWQALERQTGQIQDPSSQPNIPEFFRPRRFAVEGPEQWQRVFDEIFASLTIQQRGKFLSEIQDPIVDGLLTDPRQRALAVPHGVIHEIPASPQLQMQQAFPTVNWRQLYIGRAMESQLAKWHQITAEQDQRIQQIALTFLRTATPITREVEERRAQSEIEKVLTTEQDQLIRNEIWFAINATRLRAPLVHDQLSLDSAQRRRIDEVWNKFEKEVQENNGWLADGTDSHRQVLDDILALLTVPQRQLFFSKLQDPVFDAGYLPDADHRDRKAEDHHEGDDDPTATKSRNSESHEEAHINRPAVDADDNPLLEGPDEQLGQYHVRLRLDFTWSRPDPFPLLEAPGVIGRDRAYVELVNSLPPNVDPWLTAEQTEKFREMKSQVQSEGTTLTQQAYANWKETIRELLTEPQQRRLEQLIWQRYGCLAFLQPELQTKLKLNPSQIKAIQDAWQGHTSRTQPFDELRSEEIPERQTRTAREIDSAEQVWLTVYAVLDSSQRIEFDSIRGERYSVSQSQAANGESKVDTTKRPLLEVGDQSQ